MLTNTRVTARQVLLEIIVSLVGFMVCFFLLTRLDDNLFDIFSAVIVAAELAS